MIVNILIGLPGSGKSTYLAQHLSDYPDSAFDDFHGGSSDNSTAFKKSRHYDSLCRKLRDGKNCIISDIEYCRANRLADAEEGLRAAAGDLGIGIEIKRLYFANDPDACRHNVVHRFGCTGRRDYIAELSKIDDLSSSYQCPSDGCIPVVTCCQGSPPYAPDVGR